MNRRRFLQQGTLGASAAGLRQMIGAGAFGFRSRGPIASKAAQDQNGTFPQQAMPFEDVRLDDAVIVSRPGKLPFAEQTAAKVLVEEVQKRTAVRLATSTKWPEGKPVIVVTAGKRVAGWGHQVPARQGTDLPETRAEGYRLYVESRDPQPIVWVIGADARGALFGVGHLLRRFNWSRGRLSIASNLDLATAPAYAIRGHQLGYRTTPNT